MLLKSLMKRKFYRLIKTLINPVGGWVSRVGQLESPTRNLVGPNMLESNTRSQNCTLELPVVGKEVTRACFGYSENRDITCSGRYEFNEGVFNIHKDRSKVRLGMGARAATALRRAHLSAPLPRPIPGDRPGRSFVTYVYYIGSKLTEGRILEID